LWCPLYVPNRERVDLVRQCIDGLYQFVFMGDPDFILDEPEKSRYVFHADWCRLARTGRMRWIEDISHRRIYRAKASHFVHDNFVGAKSNKSSRAEGSMWHENRKTLRILPNQTNDSPWHGSRAAVAVNEEIDALRG
jgi:hypothetical protein